MSITIRLPLLLICCHVISALAAQPTYSLIDPNADSRTIAVWTYLQSQYGNRMLSGCWTESQYGGAEAFNSCSGKWPAIWGQDMNSWYKNRSEPIWNQVWNDNINGFKTAWERGEILQVNWHWQNVAHKVNGAYTDDAWSSLTDNEWNDIVTPGTALYNAMIEDVDYHINGFLKKIVDATGPIPILFRPLHEIDGGWFWWTCKSDPAKTARLFTIIQDRVINHHQMHNLIWIYNPGVGVDGGSWPPYDPSEYPRRQAFYVGDAHCDIVGIDLYNWDWINKGTYSPNGTNMGKTYRDAWNEMKAVSSVKMLALSESEGFPDPTKCFTDAGFAPWLYALPWFSDAANGVPCNVLSPRVNDSHMINAGDLPSFNGPLSALARITADKTSGSIPLSVQFDGSSSLGSTLTYAWSFGDGGTSTTQKPLHSFTTVGSFKVKLTVNDGSKSSSDSLTVTATEPGQEPAVRIVDDATTGTGSNQFDFAGSWSTAADSAYNNGEHWTITSGDAYTVRFYGAQVKLYGTKDAHHGIASVSIDGGTPGDIDFYAATRSAISLLWTSPALTKGNHSITVTNSGRKDAASSGTVIVGDRVDIYQIAGTTAVANPTDKGAISLQWASARSGWVALYDATGKRCKVFRQGQDGLFPTAFRSLHPGMYFAKFSTVTGTITKPVVVQ